MRTRLGALIGLLGLLQVVDGDSEHGDDDDPRTRLAGDMGDSGELVVHCRSPCVEDLGSTIHREIYANYTFLSEMVLVTPKAEKLKISLLFL